MMHLRALFALLVALPATAQTVTHTVDLNHALDVRPGEIGVRRETVAVEGLDGPATVVRVEIPADTRATGATIAVRGERRAPGHPAFEEEAPTGLKIARNDLGEPMFTPEGYAYWLLPEGDVRGRRIAHLLVALTRADDGGVRVITQFDVSIDTRPADRAALERRVSWPRTDAADVRALNALLDAPGLPRTSGARASRASVPPELDPVRVEEVIVTRESMAAAFQELADVKTRSGVPTVVTTVEWIEASYEGNDLAARIREYLRDVYVYQGLRYAILAGDTEFVPERLATNRFQAPEGVEVICQLYFSGLDGNWNADGDDHLGEGPDILFGIDGDDADFYADIAVGRVPSGSLADAEAFVTKWKSYTGNDPANFRDDYQDRFLSLGEVLFPSNWTLSDGPEAIIFDGASICESTLTFVPPAIASTRMYQYWTNPETPGAVPENRADAITAFNTGYGLVNHVGHGFRTVMSVGDGSLGNQDADAFSNTNAYSVLYAVNCTSGAISFDCIGEHLINNPMGGVIASVSSSDLDFPTVSDGMKYRFFDDVFNQGLTRIGDAFTDAHMYLLPTATVSENAGRWTLMTHILMGDPAMEIWPGTPDSLDLAFAPDMPIGAGSFPVTVTDDGGPVADATVCLFKSDGYGIAETDGAGVAVVEFLPETTGTFAITVTKSGYVPAMGEAMVIAAGTAALRVDGWTLHDGSGGGTGNADGRPDAGETLVADVTLRNDGVAAATSASATLHAGSAFLTVTDSTASVASVSAGGTATIPGAYTFTVSVDLPDTLRHVKIPATFALAAAEGSWTDERPFNVYQRLLDVTALDWSIVGDNGNGVIDAGETARVELTVENVGAGVAAGVVGVASAPSAGFLLTNDTVVFGDVLGDDAVEAGFFDLLSTGGTTADLAFVLNLSDTFGATLLTRPIDVVAPAPPDTLEFLPGATSIRLAWPQPDADDLRGYHVYRSLSPLGPFTRLTDSSADDGAFYEDIDLTELTAYYYQVASVDSSGNIGGFSDILAASTSPPELEGWPVTLPSGLSKGSPTPIDLDRNGTVEIALGWTQPMVFTAVGGDFVDGDENALTVGIFAELEQGLSRFWNSPAIADIDGDGVNEIVFAAWQTTGDGHLYVLDETGAVEAGWPQTIGKQPWSTAAIGEVDGQPGMEIFVSSGAGSGIYQGVLFGFHHDGTEILDGDSNGATNGVFHTAGTTEARFLYGSPAIADIDADGIDEIVYLEKTKHAAPSHAKIYVFDGDGTVLPGFPYDDPASLGATSSPAVADLDGDGRDEIVAITENEIFVVNHDGTDVPGWPQALPAVSSASSEIRDFLSSPAIGDVDGDGMLDIAFGWLDGNVYLYTGATGALHAGYPADVYDGDGEFDEFLRTPILGNLDGDPEPEIILSTGDNRLLAVNGDGSILQGFPLVTPGLVYGSAAVCDADGDGFVNLVVQSDAPVLSVFNFPTVPWVDAENPWPMFRHDVRKTGNASEPIAIDVPDAGTATPTVSRTLPPRPNPFSSGRVEIPFDVGSGTERVKVRVFDVSGREVRVLADGRFPGGRYRLSWDGRRATGAALPAGTYFVRTEIGTRVFAEKITLLH